ncbi:Kelch repeat-containing protein [Nocardia pseudovaccinii]|uniref:Kelch repeat-containing protein n=1 Tax=Nocardia pseudovaccinii TaxID=189540 RepID=UPI001470BD65|nr:kelch repeat-containing protein [Nocardia pseudovaccinii]
MAIDVWDSAGQLPPENRFFASDGALAGLTDGRALLAGGSDASSKAMATAALFRPDTVTWTATTPMSVGRRSHSLTRLPDGSVLAAGGIQGVYRFPFQVVGTAERFDPGTEKWTPTQTSMTRARFGHSATKLRDGRVLVAGGGTVRGRYVQAIDSVEIYDPGTDTWRIIDPMIDARIDPQTALLADGRVLVSGSYLGVGDFDYTPLAFCEIFDPSTETWSATGTMAVPRAWHRLVPLPDGGALAICGTNRGSSPGPGPITDDHSLASVERWNPITGRWTTAARLPHGRTRHHAAALDSGAVFVFGGADEHSINCGFISTYRYRPDIDVWTPTAAMAAGRYDFASAVLTDGRILVAGGNYGNDGYGDGLLDTAEIFTAA